MNQTSDILTAFNTVKTMLESISTGNGYNSDPSLKQGWLQHIFQGRHREAIQFPVIAYRPDVSNPTGGDKTHNTNLNDLVTLSLDCAVSVKESDDPVADLLNLLKDVRRSLVFDPNTARLGISEIEFLDCPFDVPETGDDYAFFSQKIRFKVVEQYA